MYLHRAEDVGTLLGIVAQRWRRRGNQRRRLVQQIISGFAVPIAGTRCIDRRMREEIDVAAGASAYERSGAG